MGLLQKWWVISGDFSDFLEGLTLGLVEVWPPPDGNPGYSPAPKHSYYLQKMIYAYIGVSSPER